MSVATFQLRDPDKNHGLFSFYSLVVPFAEMIASAYSLVLWRKVEGAVHMEGGRSKKADHPSAICIRFTSFYIG